MRCLIVLHVAASAMVLQASFHIFITLLLLIVLSVSMKQTYKNRETITTYTKLSAHHQYWLLHDINGQQLKYDTVRINFDGGFFLLLLLIDKERKKRIVLFNDQLTTSDRRFLKVLSRVVS